MGVARTLPSPESWCWLVDRTLRENVGPGDVASRALLEEDASGSAVLVAGEALVVAGLGVIEHVFERCLVRLEPLVEDGARVEPGATLGRVSGATASIQAAELTALGFLRRMCGVATHTARFCAAIDGTRARICDARKTTPGQRVLEKYAVRCGGGVHHRMGLYDGVLLRREHVASAGSIQVAVQRARQRAPFGLRIQVEVESLEEACQAIDAGADALLADGQAPDALTEMVRRASGRVQIEASGGIRLDNVRAFAQTGVDRISIRGLASSAPEVDISLEREPDSPTPIHPFDASAPAEAPVP